MSNKKIYFIVNPEGKTFENEVAFTEDDARRNFVRNWVLGSGWDFEIGSYELGVIWGIFNKRGFRSLSVNMPELKG